MLTPVSQNVMPARTQLSAPRFGNAMLRKLAQADVWLFDKVLDTRGRIMLFEDLIGFGLLRTGLDLFRTQLFGKPSREQTRRGDVPKINWLAGYERMAREILSIITDNIAAGVFASGIAWMAGRWFKTENMSNAFLQSHNRQAFLALTTQTPSRHAFFQTLGQAVSTSHAVPLAQAFEQAYQLQAKGDLQGVAKVLPNVVKTLGQVTGDVTVRAGTETHFVKCSELIEDAVNLAKHVGDKADNWSARAQQLLNNTERVNRLRLVSIPLAMLLTLVVPYVIKWSTQHWFGVTSYPGEMGLRPTQYRDPKLPKNRANQPPWYQRWFPYLSKTLQQGNFLPLLLTMIPLPIAFGMVHLPNLSKGLWKKAFQLSPKKILACFDFQKGWPYTTMQQMDRGLRC